MESEEIQNTAEMMDSLYPAVEIVNEIIQKGAEDLYNKYLESILPNHELNI